MQIITNNILPQEALSKLKNFGEIILLETEGIVYPAISNHPDIFFCTVGEELLVAPNLPKSFKNFLRENEINFGEGKKPLGQKYPATAIYNAVVTQNYLIANTKVVDEIILGLSTDKKIIHVNQAYTRCNLLPLSGEKFITSDKGIFKVLENEKMDVLYVNPAGIVLEGFKNGFFGGCCGVLENKVFIAGSLSSLAEGEKVREYLNDFDIIELYGGPLLDVGSVLFLNRWEHG